MLRRLIECRRTVHRTYARPPQALRHLSLLPLWVALVSAAQALDLLSSRVRRSQVLRPIIIIGNPRSGTTFLHRYLDTHGIATGSRILDIFLPSLILNRAASRLIARRLSGPSFSTNVAHQTGLTLVDNDDIGLMLRFLDGPLHDLGLAGFDDAARPRPNTAARDLAWMQRMWRRVMVIRGGTRIVAKFHAMTYPVRDILAAQPDAKIVYMVRDPLEAIPSAMSLSVMHVERRFGFADLPERTRQLYYRQIYAALLDGYRTFTADWLSGRTDRTRVMVIRYDRLMTDFPAIMDELLAFIGHIPTPALLADIEATSARQRAYVSHHRYDLAEFGLDEHRIRHDCRFLTDAFFPAPIQPAEHHAIAAPPMRSATAAS
jgi:hypothetical protein